MIYSDHNSKHQVNYHGQSMAAITMVRAWSVTMVDGHCQSMPNDHDQSMVNNHGQIMPGFVTMVDHGLGMVSKGPVIINFRQVCM